MGIQPLFLDEITRQFLHDCNCVLCNRPIFDARIQLRREHSLYVVFAVRYDHAIAISGIGAVRGRKDLLDGQELNGVLVVEELVVVGNSRVQTLA